MTASPEWCDVVVIGAGVSGIGASWHLRSALPEVTFTVLEARDALGGTWDLYRFPGVRSDSDLQTYAYAFQPWTSKDAIADGDAILRYLDETVAQHDLARHFRFGHRVRRLSWSSDDACWTVEAVRADGTSGGTDDGTDGETGEETVVLRCSWVIAATGYFRYERGHLPAFPHQERFQGRWVHAQDCAADVGAEGERIVVIGSGATAATIVPALTARGAHVTMLQRSPSYYLSLPVDDPIADVIRRVVSPARAYRWLRRRNQAVQALFYRLCRRFPAVMKRVLVRDVARRLPAGYDVARHFTPSYAPWDQRVCITPGGDLFRAISAGGADVVTGAIREVTAHGIVLESGEELVADVVIAATGLDLVALGDAEVLVDGVTAPAGERLVYKSVMLSDVPNLAYVFGYTNASWTLKVDLACEWICRVLAFMRERGYVEAVVSPTGPPMPTRPMLDLAAGYVRRAATRLPRQGTGVWSVPVSYRADVRRLREDPVDDGVLRFSRSRA